MPGMGRVLQDRVGTGVIQGPGALTVRCNDRIVSLVNDVVTTHGEAPHITPPITTGARTVFAEDRAVTVQAISVAQCNHVVDTGSENVNVED